MRVLITGGAGFIGSHLAHHYVSAGHDVVVFDDLSTGSAENVPEMARLVVGDIRDCATLARELAGIELVFHEAAARSVARSVEDPLGTDSINTLGTLNVLVAARDAGVRRIILASSSSVYGGAAALPTPETSPLRPRSPYAVSKLAGEHYARIFAELYGLETVALRYFNVYGPRQSPQSQYAAVIPLFVAAIRSGQKPTIHGDGRQSRDFTYIGDVVRANVLAAAAPASKVSGRAYNVACGEQHSLLELIGELSLIMAVDVHPVHSDERAGDVRASQADVNAALDDFAFRSMMGFREGLQRTVEWLLSDRHTAP